MSVVTRICLTQNSARLDLLLAYFLTRTRASCRSQRVDLLDPPPSADVPVHERFRSNILLSVPDGMHCRHSFGVSFIP